MRRIPLEEAAFKVCEQSSVPPLIFQFPPAKGRKQLEDQQNSPVNMYPANIQCEQIQINGGEEITTYFVTPKENTSVKSIIFYVNDNLLLKEEFEFYRKALIYCGFKTTDNVEFILN